MIFSLESVVWVGGHLIKHHRICFLGSCQDAVCDLTVVTVEQSCYNK